MKETKEMKETIRCEFGVVKKVWLLKENKVVLIHDPAFHETARRIQEELMAEGFNVIRLNTGVDEDRIEATKLLHLCFEQ
jgi:DNA-binding LacI/PurR family transcriptional regulator